MTAQPPSDPRPSRRRSLDFDEFIAVLVAFASLGAVLAWGLTRGNENFLTALPPIPGVTDNQTNPAQPGTPQPDGGILPNIAPAPGGAAVNPAVRPSAPEISPLPGTTVPGGTAAIVPLPIPQGNSNQPAVDRSAQTAQTVPPAGPPAFPDVPSAYWAAPFIAALTQRGDISGFQDGTFRPDQPVTRAEFATLIEDVFNQPSQENPIAFKDVPAGFWAANSIDSAVKTGFLRGFPEGTFQPDLPIPRIQALVALTSGLKLAPPASPDQSLQLFRDRDQIPNWGTPAAAAATQSGLVVNHPSPDILNPNQPATRADVAAFLYQALVATGQAAPIPSNFIVRP